MRTTVLYIRHGQNEANLTHQLSYRVVDHPLTARGRRQAQRVAEHLVSGGDGPISAVYSSPQRRASETASVIAGALGIPVIEDERMREVNVGDLDGRSDDEAWRAYRAVEAAWHGGDGAASFPGGEDLTMLLDRFRSSLRSVVEDQPGRTAVVVGHGGIVRLGVTHTFPGPVTAAITDHMANCSITELALTINGDRLTGRLETWGRTSHL